MEKLLKKAQKLFDKGKVDQSLTIYEKIIHKKFRIYAKDVVSYQLNPRKKSGSKPPKVENVKSDNLLFNIDTNRDKDNSAPVVQKIALDENTKSIKNFPKREAKLHVVMPDDRKLLERVIIDFNKVGMQYLSIGKLEEAMSILKRLVKLCKDYANKDIKLVCLTFNNVSCIHKKLGEFKMALKLLRKAQVHAENGEAEEYLSLTYINLSAIYSELKK